MNPRHARHFAKAWRLSASQRGFTLIEILVVMTIIGVLMTAVAVNLDLGEQEPESLLETEIQRLYELSRLAEDQAIISGEPVGLTFIPPDEEGHWQYRWRRYRGDQWLETQAPLSNQELPEILELSLNVEGQDVQVGELLQQWEEAERERQQRLERQRALSQGADPAEQAAQEMPPLIVFYPGGEVTPFLLTLYDKDSLDLRARLGTSLRGKVEIVPEDEDLWE